MRQRCRTLHARSEGSLGAPADLRCYIRSLRRDTADGAPKSGWGRYESGATKINTSHDRWLIFNQIDFDDSYSRLLSIANSNKLIQNSKTPGFEVGILALGFRGFDGFDTS